MGKKKKLPDDGTEITTAATLRRRRKSDLALFSAASAFSERYLGLPKPDPRAYAVGSAPTPSVSLTVIDRSPLSPSRLFFTPQMANLAHRASQFLDKKFLIIHPTADGATLFCFL